MNIIYVIRNQPGEPGNETSNCIGKSELERTQELYDIIRKLKIGHVYTCTPNPKVNNHARPLQTASNLCTLLGNDISLCNTVYNLPNYVYGNVLIVWKRSEIPSILSKYGMVGHFEWPEENYDGCLQIKSGGWEYDPNFLKKKVQPMWTWCF